MHNNALACGRICMLGITLIANVSFLPSLYSGWFGYDDREECEEQEPGKLMSRMINPLPLRQAKEAAREACRQYPWRYQKVASGMTCGQLRQAEQEFSAQQRRELMLVNEPLSIIRSELDARCGVKQ